MKVKELIKLLKGMGTEHEVIMSRDAEGNGYHELDYAIEDGDRVFIYPKHNEIIEGDDEDE